MYNILWWLILHSFILQADHVSDQAEDEFLDEIQRKVLRVFLLAITVTSTALPWDIPFFNSRNLLQFLQFSKLKRRKEENPDGKPYPPP